jgi:hypothetical protein
MTPKIKNILIFVTIAAVFILIYIFFIKAPPDESNLLILPPSPGTTGLNQAPVASGGSLPITRDFLSLLLNTKNINLDDAIFSSTAFISLRDSSIILTPDGNEGRPNPFAPIGVDIIELPEGIADTLGLDLSLDSELDSDLDLDLDIDIDLEDLDL